MSEQSDSDEEFLPSILTKPKRPSVNRENTSTVVVEIENSPEDNTFLSKEPNPTATRDLRIILNRKYLAQNVQTDQKVYHPKTTQQNHKSKLSSGPVFSSSSYSAEKRTQADVFNPAYHPQGDAAEHGSASKKICRRLQRVNQGRPISV